MASDNRELLSPFRMIIIALRITVGRGQHDKSVVFSIGTELSHGDQAEKMGENTYCPTFSSFHASGPDCLLHIQKVEWYRSHLSWVHVGQPLIPPYRGKTQEEWVKNGSER